MPFLKIKLLRVQEVDWIDKKTGEPKSMMMLEGKIESSQSFTLDEESKRIYEPLIGKEILLPYTERGQYRNIDPDVLPVLVENIM